MRVGFQIVDGPSRDVERSPTGLHAPGPSRYTRSAKSAAERSDRSALMRYRAKVDSLAQHDHAGHDRAVVRLGGGVGAGRKLGQAESVCRGADDEEVKVVGQPVPAPPSARFCNEGRGQGIPMVADPELRVVVNGGLPGMPSPRRTVRSRFERDASAPATHPEPQMIDL